MTTDTFNSGSGNWTVPMGVTSVLVELWGGGGGGGAGGAGSSAGAGGGQGGGYCAKTLMVVPSTTIAYAVGAAGTASTAIDSATNGTNGGNSTATYVATTYTAGGGARGWSKSDTGNGAGGSGLGTSTNGDLNYTGGAGSDKVSNAGGGGGSSAGTSSNGTAAVATSTGATAPTGGANGGNGGLSGFAGNAGSAPGGGGGGGGKNFAGGAGGAGRISFTYTVSGGGPTYSYTGSGGLILSGQSNVRGNVVETVSGGLILSGQSSIRGNVVETVSGGLILSGQSSIRGNVVETVSGGLILSGQSNVIANYNETASGGLILSGQSNVIANYNETASGGLILSGQSSIRGNVVETASGGLALDGTNTSIVQGVINTTFNDGFIFSGVALISSVFNFKYEAANGLIFNALFLTNSPYSSIIKPIVNKKIAATRKTANSSYLNSRFHNVELYQFYIKDITTNNALKRVLIYLKQNATDNEGSLLWHDFSIKSGKQIGFDITGVDTLSTTINSKTLNSIVVSSGDVYAVNYSNGVNYVENSGGRSIAIQNTDLTHSMQVVFLRNTKQTYSQIIPANSSATIQFYSSIYVYVSENLNYTPSFSDLTEIDLSGLSSANIEISGDTGSYSLNLRV